MKLLLPLRWSLRSQMITFVSIPVLAWMAMQLYNEFQHYGRVARIRTEVRLSLLSCLQRPDRMDALLRVNSIEDTINVAPDLRDHERAELVEELIPVRQFLRDKVAEEEEAFKTLLYGDGG